MDHETAGRERDNDVGRPTPNESIRTPTSYESDATPADNGSTATEAAKAGAQAAAGGARDVAQTAKDEARHVVREASTQARQVAGELREQVRDRARQQHGTMVSGLRRTADELRDMSTNRDDSPATNLVANLADRTQRFAEELDKRGPEGVLAEVQDFARRRPGTFLLAAVAAGFVAGRVGKSVLSAPNSPLSGGGPDTSPRGSDTAASAEAIPDRGGWDDPKPPAGAEPSGTVYASGSSTGATPQVEPVEPTPPLPPGPVPSVIQGTRP